MYDEIKRPYRGSGKYSVGGGDDTYNIKPLDKGYVKFLASRLELLEAAFRTRGRKVTDRDFQAGLRGAYAAQFIDTLFPHYDKESDF